MQTSSQSAPSAQPTSSDHASSARKPEDLAYQAVTIAAILLVLGSLWVF
jgi:hypothetical protein